MGAAAAEEAEAEEVQETGKNRLNYYNTHPDSLLQMLPGALFLKSRRTQIGMSLSMPKVHLGGYMVNYTRSSIHRTLFFIFWMHETLWAHFANQCWNISKKRKLTSRWS